MRRSVQRIVAKEESAPRGPCVAPEQDDHGNRARDSLPDERASALRRFTHAVQLKQSDDEGGDRAIQGPHCYCSTQGQADEQRRAAPNGCIGGGSPPRELGEREGDEGERRDVIELAAAHDQHEWEIAAGIVTTTAAPISKAIGDGVSITVRARSSAAVSRFSATTADSTATSTIASPVVNHSATAALHHGTAWPAESKLATGT